MARWFWIPCPPSRTGPACRSARDCRPSPRARLPSRPGTRAFPRFRNRERWCCWVQHFVVAPPSIRAACGFGRGKGLGPIRPAGATAQRWRDIGVVLVGRNLLEGQFVLVVGFLPGLLGRFRVAGGVAGPGEMVQPQARGLVAHHAAQFGHGLVEAAGGQQGHAAGVEVLGIRPGKLDRPIGKFQGRGGHPLHGRRGNRPGCCTPRPAAPPARRAARLSRR